MLVVMYIKFVCRSTEVLLMPHSCLPYHYIPTSCYNVSLLLLFTAEVPLQVFPLEYFNFQEPHKIPTTSKAAAPPATTPPRKDPATVAPADSAAVIDSPVRNQL